MLVLKEWKHVGRRGCEKDIEVDVEIILHELVD
jgi:hypothetical protein